MAEDPNTPVSNMYKNNIEKSERDKISYDKYVYELNNSEKFKDYFSKYTPDSVERFINYYVTFKMQWYEYKEVYKKVNENEANQWIGGALKALEEIKQKKLFNLQCLWRAEKMKSEAIKICYDFDNWERQILWCPVVDIEQSDIDFFIHFLNESSLDFDFQEMHCSQDHGWVIKDYTERENLFYYTKWYEFYDKEFGTDSYLKLPDLRGDKEDVYIKLEYEERVRLNPEMYAYSNDTTRLPDLKCYEDNFIEIFIKENETPSFYEGYMEQKKTIEVWDENDEIDADMEILMENESMYYPIVPAKDWRIAIKRTAEKYRRERTIELLPQAFEMYKKHKGEKFYFPSLDYKSFEDMEEQHHFKNGYMKKIMTGRKLKGEPEDLNF